MAWSQPSSGTVTKLMVTRRISKKSCLEAGRFAANRAAMQTLGMSEAMSVAQVHAIYELLDQNDVRCLVMGGWGVDALLGRVTREHKDLDLLVQITDLPRYADIVHAHGFKRKLEWSESLPIRVNALHFDSAFVDAHPDGREIDVHVIDVDPSGVVTLFHTDPWPLPHNAVSGAGTIQGATVRCVTRAAQIAMHSGYDLPEKHRDDVRLMQLAT